MKRIAGLCLALILFSAFASVSLAQSLTNAQVLDSLNVAHSKMECGDASGAKVELSALSAKLATSTNPIHKEWRRQVQWMAMKLSMGMIGSAETTMHELLKIVSSASSRTPPPAFQATVR